MGSIFDNLDLSGVTGSNPFAFMQQEAAPTPAPPAPPPPPVDPAAAQAGFLGQSPDMTTAEPGPGAAPGGGGFLSRLTAPSPDGITFQDKLMALGHILQGNSGEASKYLGERRQTVAKAAALEQKTKDAEAKQQQAQIGMSILAKHWGEKGLDVAGYLTDMATRGLAPNMEDIKRAADMGKMEPLNMGAAGGAYGFHPYGGGGVSAADQIVKPQAPKAPPGYHWVGNPLEGDFREAADAGGARDTSVVEATAAAKRRGAPPVGRAPKARKSYGANEVQWGH